MIVECFESEFDIPDIAIEKFAKDFDCLAGSGNRSSVEQLRNSIWDVVDSISEEPQLLEEPECMEDFIRALAMKKAMEKHGIYLDS